MKTPGIKKKSGTGASHEFWIGFLAILLGAFNLLTTFGVINLVADIPQVVHIVGNILLVIAGLFLWITAYKLGRFKYHTKSLF